ncbi:MAG TPA: hypothetical protein VGK00_17575 [Anaerolineales bacterium]|jgi:hypothetical protein
MDGEAFPYRRIIVIGVTGAGKSTLAERLARQFNLVFVELDALHWLPGWQELPDDQFRACVEQATLAPGWVVAGNYSAARDITWPRAEAVIWLDYPLWTVFWRLWRRTWRRWWTRELLWGSNYENLWPQFKLWAPQESLFGWLFKTYGRRKREYPLLFALPEYAHLQVIRLCTPRETDEWLARLSG